MPDGAHMSVRKPAMFDGFQLRYVEIAEGSIRLRIGGNGPPLLLLHGHPRTHMTWGKTADLLSSSFTVICPICRASEAPIFQAMQLTAVIRRSGQRLPHSSA